MTMKLYYNPVREDIRSGAVGYDFKSCFTPCTPSSSKWWKKLPPFLLDSKNIIEWFNKAVQYNLVGTTPGTVKMCPGINTLFKHSFLYKLPCDLLLTTTKDSEYAFKTSDPFLRVEAHLHAQIASKGEEIYSNKFNIKLTLPYYIKTSKYHMFTVIPPVYHNSNVPYDVMPGVIETNINAPVGCNLNLMFEKKDETYFFKKDTVMAYFMSHTHNAADIKMVETDEPFKMRTSFYNWHKNEL